MAEHFVRLVVEGGELHPSFVCVAPEDADCRRRPRNAEGGEAPETWTADQATEPGFDCWAVEWVDAVGLPDAMFSAVDGVLAAVPVSITYCEGVQFVAESGGSR